MKIAERALIVYRQNSPMRHGYGVAMTDIEQAICAAVDKELDALRSDLKDARSRLHAIETRGEHG